MLTPKYNIGETVWIISDNKIKASNICGVFVGFQGMGGSNESIFYLFDSRGLGYSSLWYKEELIFSSKEALINSL